MKQYAALSKHSRYRFRLGNQFTTFIHSMYIVHIFFGHWEFCRSNERMNVLKWNAFPSNNLLLIAELLKRCSHKHNVCMSFSLVVQHSRTFSINLKIFVRKLLQKVLNGILVNERIKQNGPMAKKKIVLDMKKLGEKEDIQR